jgi:hypothetical protein
MVAERDGIAVSRRERQWHVICSKMRNANPRTRFWVPPAQDFGGPIGIRKKAVRTPKGSPEEIVPG